MKLKFLFPLMVMCVFMISGCGAAPSPSPTPTLTPVVTASPSVSASPLVSASVSPSATDVTTTASIVNDNAAFEKAISKTGTWIICTLKDLTFTTDLTLDGDFKNSSDQTQRKIILCTEDANRNPVSKFTLTAPKLTINSPSASIVHGTFKGDIYVNQNNFTLTDTTVDGNVYFSSDAIKSTYTKDSTSKVTGTEAVK